MKKKLFKIQGQKKLLLRFKKQNNILSNKKKKRKKEGFSRPVPSTHLRTRLTDPFGSYSTFAVLLLTSLSHQNLPNPMDEADRTTGEFTDEEDDARRSSVFAELKPYCVELLELLQNPTTKHSSAIPALLQLLRSSHPSALQPFFEYAPFLTFTFTYMLPFVYTNNSFWFSVT